MATLPARAGKLLARAGKLLSKCSCCCACKSTWCCNAPKEIYATLSITGGTRRSQNTFGSGNTAYTVSIDCDVPQINATYTLSNDSFFKPCGTIYNTYVGGYSTSGEVPQIQVAWSSTLGPNQTPGIGVFVDVFLPNGGSNYRRTGYVPSEDLNRPFGIFFRKYPLAVMEKLGDKYPCERWDALGSVSSSGGVVSQSDNFNFYNQFVGSQMSSWSPNLEMTVSFSV